MKQLVVILTATPRSPSCVEYDLLLACGCSARRSFTDGPIPKRIWHDHVLDAA